jgi:signal transduction histidine kinase
MRRFADVGDYLFAAAAVAVAALLRLAWLGLLGPQAPFFPFVLAVLAAAWRGGLMPGLLATALGAVLGVLLYGAPFDPAQVAFITTLFAVIGATASWFCGRLHAARKELRQQIQQRELAEQMLRQFLAVLAHELRNHLAPVYNAVELLGRARGNAALIEQSRGLLDRQVRQMIRLMDDLLDVSRIARGKLSLCVQRVELAVVVQTAVEAARPLIEAQAHELAISLPPEPTYLEADPTRLAQVLANLLINAAKYTPRGGRIWLTGWREDEEVVVAVRDSGIGLTAEQLPRLFEMFSQVDAAKEKSQGGLGVGLALVKGLVGMHGGRAEANSEGAGKGSEFVVRLPLKLP